MTRLLRVLAREHANGSRVLRSRPVLPVPVQPALLALGLLVMSVAGCGSSDNGVAAKSASEILAATRAAAQSASSVHVVVSAKVLTGRPFKLDVRLGKRQAHARVLFFGSGFEAIRDNNTVYIKGNTTFDERLESALGVKVPSGVWLKATTSSLRQIGSFTDIGRELPVILSGSGKVSKGAEVKIDGQPAITIKLTRKLYTGTLYVATTGPPYPLKLTKTGEETGQTTFTGWNDPVTVSPPSKAVEIGQLQQIKGH
jgi:hypothetical protein